MIITLITIFRNKNFMKNYFSLVSYKTVVVQQLKTLYATNLISISRVNKSIL